MYIVYNLLSPFLFLISVEFPLSVKGLYQMAQQISSVHQSLIIFVIHKIMRFLGLDILHILNYDIINILN